MVKRLNNVQFQMIQETKSAILNNLSALKYMGFKYLDPIKFDTSIVTHDKLPDDLESLGDIVNNCSLCSLSKSRKNVLFGLGNKNADIMFLSLIPTSLEDDSGDILSGNSGDMMINMCQHVLGLNISDIYVTSIVKCFSNKDFDLELNTCKPYVQKQIEIINPKIIVAFGEVYEYLTKEKKELKEIRGTVQDYNKIKVIPTYDPSFILRNPSFKKDVLEDLKKVKSIMESL